MRGGGVPYCSGGRIPRGKHGVGSPDDPLTAGRRCGGGHYVVVPALEDPTPDLRRGVVAVCRWGGGGVVVGAAEAGGAEGVVAVWCGGLFPLLRMVQVRRVVLLRWHSL